MVDLINGTADTLLSSYDFVISSLNPVAGKFVNLFVIVVLIFIYSVSVWKLHKIISKKNIFEMNLDDGTYFGKGNFKSALLYFLEYLIILPFFVFACFAVFAIFLIIFIGSLDISLILIISAATFTSIRMAAYYNDQLSRELAKLLPLNLLAASIIFQNNFFSVERIITQFKNIPQATGDIFSYLAFIIMIEVTMRFFDFIFSIFGIEEENEEVELDIGES